MFIDSLLTRFISYRKRTFEQKLREVILFCSVCFLTSPLTAITADGKALTPRENRLKEILEESGENNNGLLLSEQFRQNSTLKRTYVEIFTQPDWVAHLSLNSSFESFRNEPLGLAGSLSIDSTLQLGNSVELSGAWSMHCASGSVFIWGYLPCLSPTIESLILTYGKLRTVEISGGIPVEQSLFIPNTLAGSFSGLGASVQPLGNFTDPHATHFRFNIEHGWGTLSNFATPQTGVQQIQRTRPRINFSQSQKSMSLQGEAALEWYTDPQKAIEYLSSGRSRHYQSLNPTRQKKWRLFVIQGNLEFAPLPQTHVNIFATRVNNSLETEANSGWSATFSLSQKYIFAGAQNNLAVSATVFDTQENSTPRFRLPLALTPASRGELTQLSLSILPQAKNSREYRIGLNYLRETRSEPVAHQPGCQESNITENKICSFFFGQVSVLQKLGPNL